MLKCLIASKTFPIQINDFLQQSEDKEKMESDILEGA